MGRRVIVDTSVAIKWVMAEPLSDKADALLFRTDLFAPDFLDYEMARVLARNVRRRILSPRQTHRMRTELAEKPVSRIDWVEGLDHAFDLSLELRTDLADCIFLELAMRLGDVMVTADERFFDGVTSSPKLARYVVALENA
jgi:predicted nucleic acid-binding protein